MATRNRTRTTIKAQPSDIAAITEDQLGEALANLRREMRNAKGEDLKAMQRQRDELSTQLDQFVQLHLVKIDNDPEVKAAVDQLNQLCVDIQIAVREMRDVTEALKKASKVIGFADKFLGIVFSAIK